MSSLGAPRRPSDPAGGGDNNRADTWTQSASERNLEWVRKRVNGRREPPLRRARMCLEPLGASQPDGVLDEGPRRGVVGDPQPGPYPPERVARQSAAR